MGFFKDRFNRFAELDEALEEGYFNGMPEFIKTTKCFETMLKYSDQQVADRMIAGIARYRKANAIEYDNESGRDAGALHYSNDMSYEETYELKDLVNRVSNCKPSIASLREWINGKKRGYTVPGALYNWLDCFHLNEVYDDVRWDGHGTLKEPIRSEDVDMLRRVGFIVKAIPNRYRGHYVGANSEVYDFEKDHPGLARGTERYDRELLKYSGLRINVVRPSHLSEEICYETCHSVRQDGRGWYDLKLIPMKYRSERVCLSAYKVSTRNIFDIPVEYIQDYMIFEAAKELRNPFKYIPDDRIPHEAWVEMVRHDPANGYQRVPESHRSRCFAMQDAVWIYDGVMKRHEEYKEYAEMYGPGQDGILRRFVSGLRVALQNEELVRLNLDEFADSLEKETGCDVRDSLRTIKSYIETVMKDGYEALRIDLKDPDPSRIVYGESFILD